MGARTLRTLRRYAVWFSYCFASTSRWMSGLGLMACKLGMVCTDRGMPMNHFVRPRSTSFKMDKKLATAYNWVPSKAII